MSWMFPLVYDHFPACVSGIEFLARKYIVSIFYVSIVFWLYADANGRRINRRCFVIIFSLCNAICETFHELVFCMYCQYKIHAYLNSKFN